MTKQERDLRAKIAALAATGDVLNAIVKRTPEQDAEFKSLTAELTAISEELDNVMALDKAKRTVSGTPIENEGQKAKKSAHTLGEHFIAECGKALASATGNFSPISATEFTNALTDTHLTTDKDNVLAPALTDIDKTVELPYRRATVTDLFPAGPVAGNAVTYFQQITLPNKLGTVKEGAKKHQRFYEFKSVTDPVVKIAGFTKISEEMQEDAGFIVSEINDSLLYDLELGEEYQLLNGDGVDPNMRGLLNREYIQTETATSKEDNPDALFRAARKIQTVTGLTADGIIINPLDYENLRLKKDNNGQYLGGGFFSNAYGGAGLTWEPPIWGFRTVISNSVDAGTAIVGSFARGAKRLMKGGIRVEATKTNEDDFVTNKITIRAEKRSGLQVRRPQAFVKVTFATTL